MSLWDLPTRLFHWALALAVTAALVTGSLAGPWLEWHLVCGLTILWLLVFRLVWGFLGNTYARFAQFWPTPRRLRGYFAGRWQQPGHTPLGALSVLAMLAMLSLQVGLGLFSRDETGFRGPLSGWLGSSAAAEVTAWHHLVAGLVLLLVLLHLAAILFYRLVRGRDLVTPMITGRLPTAHGTGAQSGQRLLLLLAVVLASAVVVLVLYLQPAPVVVTEPLPAW